MTIRVVVMECAEAWEVTVLAQKTTVYLPRTVITLTTFAANRKSSVTPLERNVDVRKTLIVLVPMVNNIAAEESARVVKKHA